MNSQDSNMAANAICHAAQMVQYTLQETASTYALPHVLYRPRLSKDGNQYCALFGADLQTGVSGFGVTPAAAMADFDVNWHKAA